MLDRRRALELLSERLPEIRTQFGVSEPAIFGSIARDQASADSDVDVLVAFADQPSFDDYMGLKIYLEDLFVRKVDLAIRSDLREAIRPRIEAEAIGVPFDETIRQGVS